MRIELIEMKNIEKQKISAIFYNNQTILLLTTKIQYGIIRLKLREYFKVK